MHAKYVSTTNIAKVCLLFETYCYVTRKYGSGFNKSSFSFIANKASNIALNVAIKNKILKLSQLSTISYAQVEDFLTSGQRPDATLMVTDVVRI